MARVRSCAKCGSSDVKVYPEEFGASKWPMKYVSQGVRMAGGPDPTRPILVCQSCGHNEDLPQRLP